MVSLSLSLRPTTKPTIWLIIEYEREAISLTTAWEIHFSFVDRAARATESPNAESCMWLAVSPSDDPVDIFAVYRGDEILRANARNYEVSTSPLGEINISGTVVAFGRVDDLLTRRFITGLVMQAEVHDVFKQL